MKNTGLKASALIFTAIFAACIASIGTYVAVSNKINNLAFNQSIFSKVATLNELVNDNYIYDYDTNELTDNLLKAYLSSIGDKYATYYTKEEYRAAKNSLNSVFEGIGVSQYYDSEKKNFIISYVMENSPAQEQGLKIGDRIVGVGESLISDIGMEEALKRLKGSVGTSVLITVLPKDTTKTKDIIITRKQFTTTSVDFYMYDKIGVVRIREFTSTTPTEFKNAMTELKNQGMESVIFDLRNNGGGELDSVLSVLDECISDGVLVTLKYKDKELVYKAKTSNELKIPAVVLTNNSTASAAELFTSCLSDHKKAAIIGTNTYGKMVGQKTYVFQDDSAVKFTIFTYLPPSGESFANEGIAPDIEVSLPYEYEPIIYGLTIDQDVQLSTAIEHLGGTINTNDEQTYENVE